MSVGALFGNVALHSRNENLVEFKAGKMFMRGKMVYPDTRKGLVCIYQSEDFLVHFCWKNRQTFRVEDDLIIVREECEFKKVPQCTTGRVYVLKFKSCDRKHIFWLQEPKTEKDEEICRQVNNALNNPPGPERNGIVARDGDLQNLNNIDVHQWLQLLSGAGQIGGLPSLLDALNFPSSDLSSRTTSTRTAAATSSTTASNTTVINGSVSSQTSGTITCSTNSQQNSSSSSGSSKSTVTQKRPNQLSELQNLFSELPAPPSKRASETQLQNIDLSSFLNSENLQTVLSDPNLVNSLQQHLPSPSVESETPTELLRSTLTSPQFQQSVSMFSTAFQSGQLGPVVQQFELGPEAVTAAQQGNIEEFMKALEEASTSKDNEENDESEISKKRKKSEDKKEVDDDDEMDLR